MVIPAIQKMEQGASSVWELFTEILIHIHAKVSEKNFKDNDIVCNSLYCKYQISK